MSAKKTRATPKPIGRPTDYTEAAADLICERLAQGESLRGICRDDAQPALSTVFRWLTLHPEFSEQYARAREEQAEAFADEIVAISDEECTTVRADKHSSRDDDGEGNTEVVFDSVAVARNRLRIDARKWVAAKLKPKKYGDKLAIGGAEDLPPIRSAVTLSEAELTAIAAGQACG